MTAPRPRDSQRSRLYRAEREAFGPAFGTGEEQFVNSLAAIDDWLLSHVRSDWWPSRTAVWAAVPRKTWHTRDGRGSKRATGGMHHVSFPRWARNRYVVLHEFAHHLTHRTYGRQHAAHGPEFCDLYLWLVRHALGITEARKLEAAYIAHNIRYKPVRKKVAA